MSKIITAIVIAAIAASIASFVISTGANVPFTSFHAMLAGGLLGLFIG